jgi:hypothetical protein
VRLPLWLLVALIWLALNLLAGAIFAVRAWRHWNDPAEEE